MRQQRSVMLQYNTNRSMMLQWLFSSRQKRSVYQAKFVINECYTYTATAYNRLCFFKKSIGWYRKKSNIAHPLFPVLWRHGHRKSKWRPPKLTCYNQWLFERKRSTNNITMAFEAVGESDIAIIIWIFMQFNYFSFQ